MTCCAGYEREFSERRARRSRRNYQRGRISETTRLLADAIAARDLQGTELLDIGGGIGVLPLLLLPRGVDKARNIEASPGYRDVARTLADAEGLGARIEYVDGDFVTLATNLASADVVTLDRVICCYPDMPALVGASARCARRYVGAVFPRNLLWVRLWLRAENLFHWFRRCEFRAFVHSPVEIEHVLRREGLRPCFTAASGSWHVVLYERQSDRPV